MYLCLEDKKRDISMADRRICIKETAVCDQIFRSDLYNGLAESNRMEICMER